MLVVLECFFHSTVELHKTNVRHKKTKHSTANLLELKLKKQKALDLSILRRADF